jgi:hypothetical protein
VNLNERFDRLDTFIEQGRLVRKAWGDGQGRACLLLALAPEVGAEGAVERCPAYLIPAWLAYLTPGLDDNGTEAAWPTMVRRYSIVVRRGATTLDDAGWRRVLARTMLAVLAEAAPHDPSGSCQRVSELWTRVLTGEEPRAEEWAAAAAGARAARAAARAGARAAEAWAAEAWAAEAAAEAASESAAEAASEAAPAAVAAAAAAWAAGFTWDRITTALLDGIELECGEHRREETQ